MRIVLAGGGTFGHVGPLLVTADELRRRWPEVELRVVGTASGLEASLVPQAGLRLAIIPKTPWPRRPGVEARRFIGAWRQAVAAADALLKDFKPDGVVGFGGYVSPPVYWAAFRNKVAVVVHEANARPGLANRWGARRAAAVGVALAGTPLPNARLVGMPLRPGLARLDRAGSRAQARRQLGLDPVKPTLLVAGGSLGALNLNQAAAAVASELIGAGAQVLHLTGRGKSQAVRLGLGSLNASQTASYHIMEYLESMELALAAADLALQRAGAATVAELACAGLPAVLVPLRIGNGEQRHNAAGLVKAGAAVLVTDDEIGHWVTGNLAELLTSPDRLAAMSQAASSIAIRDGAERLVDLIEEVTR